MAGPPPTQAHRPADTSLHCVSCSSPTPLPGHQSSDLGAPTLSGEPWAVGILGHSEVANGTGVAPLKSGSQASGRLGGPRAGLRTGGEAVRECGSVCWNWEVGDCGPWSAKDGPRTPPPPPPPRCHEVGTRAAGHASDQQACRPAVIRGPGRAAIASRDADNQSDTQPWRHPSPKDEGPGSRQTRYRPAEAPSARGGGFLSQPLPGLSLHCSLLLVPTQPPPPSAGGSQALGQGVGWGEGRRGAAADPRAHGGEHTREGARARDHVGSPGIAAVGEGRGSGHSGRDGHRARIRISSRRPASQRRAASVTQFPHP